MTLNLCQCIKQCKCRQWIAGLSALVWNLIGLHQSICEEESYRELYQKHISETQKLRLSCESINIAS